jgi:hypothetical protein
MPDLVDLYAPAAPGSLMRSIKIDKSGRWRVARRSCELVSVMIASAGAWGRFEITDGTGRTLFMQPSTFTGSFMLLAGAEEGLIAHVDSMDYSAGLTLDWREEDEAIV